MARAVTLTALFLAFRVAGQAAPQTITFESISDQLFGVSPFVIAAQASSGLPVTLNSTSPAVCRITGNLVMLLSPGPCFITASQSGDSTWSAAPAVTRNFSVNAAQPSGTLTASAASPFAAGTNPVALAAADFNGDGIQDLAIANNGSSNITVLLGDGLGGFSPAPGSPFAAGTNPACIVVGDFNGDGIPDVVVSGANDGNATVLLGNGSGGFSSAPGSPFSVGPPARSLAVGDFNGDGVQDLAFAGANGTVGIFLGTGSGTFTAASGSPFTAGTESDSVVAGDYNGDGIPDLAIADSFSDSVQVLLGNGSGGFTAAAGSPFAVDPALSPVSLAAGDFNGDGILDLAVACTGSQNVPGIGPRTSQFHVIVLLGNGAGGFSLAPGGPYQTALAPTSLVGGDFNGDGHADVAVTDTTAIVVLLGDGTGKFSSGEAAFAPTGAPIALVAADFNRDGVQDLAVAQNGAGSVAVLLGGQAATNSLLSTTSPATIQAGQSASLSVAVSDVSTSFAPPTGTATFLDRGAIIGVATATGSSFSFTTGNLAAGSHPLVALYSGDSRSAGSVSNAITIQVNASTPVPQTIAFAEPGSVTFPAASFDLTATASSGLPVAFTSTTPGVCTVAGSSLTPVAAGICTVTATQTGNATYAAATPVTQSFTINPAVSSGGGGGGGGGGGAPPPAGNPLTVSPASVTINATTGGPPGTQTVTLTYPTFTQGAPTFSSNFTTNQGQVWLSATPVSGTMTQAWLVGLQYTYTATVTIQGDPTGIAAGSVYTGTVNFSSAGGIVSVPVTLNVTVPAQPLPQPTGGIANAASAGQATPGVVGSGTYVAIYGKLLAGSGSPAAAALPLPATLNGTQVTLGGLPMPLLYAASGQINGLVPQGLGPNKSYPLVVTTGTAQSAPVMLLVNELQPGIYTVDTSGSGPGIVTNAVSGQLNNASNPAHASDYLVIYCTGLGPVQGPNGEAEPADGAAVPNNVLYSTTAKVTATIGGVSAPVLFSGLTATFAGLYQVNVQVPAGVPAGSTVPVVIGATDSQTGATAGSNSVTITVQ